MSNFEMYRLKRKAYLDETIKRGRLRDGYQDEEIKADPKKGRKLIKKIRDEEGIEDRIRSEDYVYEDVFAGVFSDNPGAGILYPEIGKLSEMVKIAERETSERRAALRLLMDHLIEIYYVPEMELDVRRSVTGAFLEYNYSVELICRKLSYIRTACLYYGIWLVKDTPLDKIIAAKIKELLDKEVYVYDDDIPVSMIPGYNLCWDGGMVYQGLNPEQESDLFGDYESIMEGIDEVEEYILKHPHQVDVQCLMSVFTETQGLAYIAARAAALDDAIDRYTITDECRNMDNVSWGKLFDGWVMVKAFSHVTGRILRFVDECQESTVGEATKALESILQDISYASVERNIRVALRQTILEGGVYEFELSKVCISDSVRKVSRGYKCLNFFEAGESVKQELISGIRNEKRPVYLPQDYVSSEALERHSLICLKDDEIKGVFFIIENGDSIELLLAYVTENTAFAALVVNSYETLVSRYGSDKKIVIPVINDNAAMLVEKFVPGAVRERLIRAQHK